MFVGKAHAAEFEDGSTLGKAATFREGGIGGLPPSGDHKRTGRPPYRAHRIGVAVGILKDVDGFDGADERARAVAALKHVGGFKPANRRAKRRARDPELFGKITFSGQPIAARESIALYVVENTLLSAVARRSCRDTARHSIPPLRHMPTTPRAMPERPASFIVSNCTPFIRAHPKPSKRRDETQNGIVPHRMMQNDPSPHNPATALTFFDVFSFLQEKTVEICRRSR